MALIDKQKYVRDGRYLKKDMSKNGLTLFPNCVKSFKGGRHY